VLGLGVVWFLLTSIGGSGPAVSYHWDFRIVEPYLPVLLEGLGLTLELSIASIALGMALGLFVAMARLSSIAAVRAGTTLYVEVMRGTPPLIQLVWVYYALPVLTGIQLPAFESVVLAFTLNLGAFYGEAFRSGIQAIPQEQVEAGEILGLSYVQRMQYVVVPQAFRIVLPVLISISISLFKDTSLVSFLGVSDLLYQGHVVSDVTYRPLEIYTTVALLYFAIAFPITLIMRRYELHLHRHLAETK